MGGERRYGWRRLVNRYTPLASAIVGAALVASNLLFLGNRAMWFATIVGGLLILQGGVWYASRPFLTSERRYDSRTFERSPRKAEGGRPGDAWRSRPRSGYHAGGPDRAIGLGQAA